MGLVGRRHAAAINQLSSVEICAVVDADDAITAQVANAGIESYNDLCAMINATRPDGIIPLNANKFAYVTGIGLRRVWNPCPDRKADCT
jgi:ABC-type enterochelin transport system substrate-binding protein